MRRFILPLVVVFLFLVDLYVFQGLKAALSPFVFAGKEWIFRIYWIVTFLCWISILTLPAWRNAARAERGVLFTVVISLYLAKLFASVFFVIDDLRRLVWVVILLGKGTSGNIPRSPALSWAGLVTGTALLALMIHGFGNKYAYKIRRVHLRFPDLPAAFRGLKIIQVSDIHSGSFHDKAMVERGVDMILEEKPNIIFFTGDLVNNRAEEAKGYVDVFSRLHAPLGVYAILGNHDYGDYVSWPDAGSKARNLQELKDLEASMGWKMLNNDHVLIHRDGVMMAVIGVENWSDKARFPKYGDLQRAAQGTEQAPFKILLSHDPSHWDAEVRQRYPDIDLMLAGHTHGMQFGIEVPGLRWSPVQWMYKRWAGLYQEGSQYLYVNRGFGFLGYPGRVGILPEITVIELA
jgi:predicted MPP superfamily phosphohydrolase